MHDHDGNDQTGAQRVRFFQYQAGSGRLLKNVRQSWSNSTPDVYWFDVKFWTNIKAGLWSGIPEISSDTYLTFWAIW